MAQDDRRLTSGQVAWVLGVERTTVFRIPKEALDYVGTPGGHRRYRLGDVRRYGTEVLHLEPGDFRDVADMPKP